nr:hypothetical protein CFP56_69327 [Quercus suber]
MSGCRALAGFAVVERSEVASPDTLAVELEGVVEVVVEERMWVEVVVVLEKENCVASWRRERGALRSRGVWLRAREARVRKMRRSIFCKCRLAEDHNVAIAERGGAGLAIGQAGLTFAPRSAASHRLQSSDQTWSRDQPRTSGRWCCSSKVVVSKTGRSVFGRD